MLQDYIELLKAHRENDADITIATHSVGWGQANRRGLTRVDPETGAALTAISRYSQWSPSGRTTLSAARFWHGTTCMKARRSYRLALDASVATAADDDSDRIQSALMWVDGMFNTHHPSYKERIILCIPAAMNLTSSQLQ